MVKIPTLTEPSIRLFMACGALSAEQSAASAGTGRLEADGLVAQFGPKDASLFTRLFGDGGRHLHLDIARVAYFRKPPKVTSTIAELSNSLTRFISQPIILQLTAVFALPLDQLPKGGLIRDSLAEFSHGDIMIRQRGARLEFEGGPIESLEWRVQPDDTAILELTATVETKVTENYLVEYLRLMEAAFRTMALQEIRS